MKFMIALFALFAAASAQYLTTGGLYGPGVVTTGILPSSRLTRSDWVQPGVRYNVPAVAQYQSITPGFTTVQQTATPIVARTVAAPLIATNGLIGGAYTNGLGLASPLLATNGLIGGAYTNGLGLASPLGALRYIRK